MAKEGEPLLKGKVKILEDFRVTLPKGVRDETSVSVGDDLEYRFVKEGKTWFLILQPWWKS